MAVILKEKIKTYIENTRDNFTLEQICESIRSELVEDVPDLENRILNIIHRHTLLFHDEDSSLFIPRALYFHKARFLIVPTNEEILAGILIPGHRFVPFCNPDMFPAESHHLYDTIGK
jgi:hypothetical protein